MPLSSLPLSMLLTPIVSALPDIWSFVPVLNTNYGATALDIYAPGTDIYSSYMGDTYQKGTGEGMASATVAGVAAIVKSYFPKLTGSQIRDILLKSVTSRKGVEVEKGIRVNDSP